MTSLLSLLLTLHVGTLAVPPTAAALPFRMQARLVAEQTLFHRAPPIGIVASSRVAVSPTLPLPADVLIPALAPGATLRSDEWVALFADRLEIGSSRIAHAAVWFASIPVQLDVRPGHFSMRVTVRTQ